MWYEDPQWWAIFISGLISTVSLVLSYRAYRSSNRASRISVEQDLTQHAIEINEAFIRHHVKSPFAHHLGISDEASATFTAKAVLLLHHINFLRTVHTNKDLLGASALKSYENWASSIVRPWIEADPELRQTWLLIRNSKDSYSKDFMDWLEKLFPIFN